jgi:chromosome segregation ATPase
VTIGEKEKKIYELKKRNQELEKFKFVLDFKIKELKRQIEPRENEIADMRRQIKEVDTELETYHKSNAELDLLIGSLREQLDELQQDILGKRSKLQSQEASSTAFYSQLYEVVQQIQHPEALAAGMSHLYTTHVSEAVLPPGRDKGIEKEYHRQKDYLQRSIAALKKKLESDSTEAKNENARIMLGNMELIGQVNTLRAEVKRLRGRKGATLPAGEEGVDAEGGQKGGGLEQTIAQQREEIGTLKGEIARLERLLMAARPASREPAQVL